ncbi:MAG: hypothetical protein M3275_00380 [Thermoproteota archaeon]|nr:hypothetical protein [Thermoproteota archaeon]MDQ3966832.1 hypothetical protein [Thermoproteota archaeon]
MNLDKLINRNKLFERLDKLYPDTTSKDKNDGINYWKGKRIVSLAEWRKIANSGQAFQKGVEYQNTEEALQYFPNDYSKWLFPLGVQDELIRETNKWYLQYLELMQHRKNPNYGKTKCIGCLLSTYVEEGGLSIGINKVIARGLSKEDADNSIYPCPIQNRFECPYEIKDKVKAEAEEVVEAKSTIDVDQLFQLSEIAFLVELAFATAEKDTSKIQIKSHQDVYHALTHRETLNAILQQGLDEEHQKYKDKIVELFMSIKDKIRIEDLTFYG